MMFPHHQDHRLMRNIQRPKGNNKVGSDELLKATIDIKAIASTKESLLFLESQTKLII